MPIDNDDQPRYKSALNDARVATVPDVAFGTPRHARIPFVTDCGRIREEFDRLYEPGYIQS